MSKESDIYNNLKELYNDIPENKLKLVDGLIIEASRLKVSLDELWEDIQKNGNVEIDDKGREKERSVSAIFTARDKSYRSCIRQLDSLLPSGQSKSTGFTKLDEEDEDDDS